MMLHTIAGIALIVGALALVVTTPDNASLSGWVYLSIALGQLRFSILWRPVLIVLLSVVGSYLFVSGLVPRRWLMALLAGWGIVYTSYLVGLALSGHTMLLQYFDFRHWSDLPYLLLTCAYIGITFCLFLEPRSRADLYGVTIGLLSGYVLLIVGSWSGPGGAPIGAPLQIATFIAAMPVWLLALISLVAMGINLLRTLWWEVRGWPIPPKRLS